MLDERLELEMIVCAEEEATACLNTFEAASGGAVAEAETQRATRLKPWKSYSEPTGPRV